MVTTSIALGDIVLQAREQLNRLTGLDLASTLAMKKTEEGWQVVLEDRKSTRLNSSHIQKSRMPSSA